MTGREYKRRYRASHPEYCERERAQRAAYRAARNIIWRAELHELLSMLGCADCGGAAVHFHHVDSSIRHKNVSDMGDYSKRMRDAELRKCVPLCASCHAKRHHRSQNFGGVAPWSKRYPKAVQEDR